MDRRVCWWISFCWLILISFTAVAAANKVQEMLNADDRAAAEKEKVADRVAADPGELEGEDCCLLVDLQGLILGRSPKF